MDVQLYVYDLSRGMARAMSRQFLGIQIDAVYHTSLVFGNIEYFFGAGVQTCHPGTTHHGRPMEIIPLGRTQLPMDVVMDYLDSLREVYTPESYDLFEHNCNNFTHDFSVFLLGSGIPAHITSLPRRVLESPFGQMLKPQLDASMRGITQAAAPAGSVVPTPSSSSSLSNGNQQNGVIASAKPATAFGAVVEVKSLGALEKRLSAAKDAAATVFFTSSTCAPCKLAYPTFDRLAEQYPHALFVKVDIDAAQDAAARYQIRATPTFMTFARGAKTNEWQGADPNLLKSNVELLINEVSPTHPHFALRVQTLQFGSLKPITYTKVPPLEKLMAKLGDGAKDDNLVALREFVERRSVDPKDAPLPDLGAIGTAFREKILQLPVEVRFAAVDLLRCALVDARVGGFFAEERAQPGTVAALVESVVNAEQIPHNLRLVTVHLASNVFASQLFIKELLREGTVLAPLMVQLVGASLLDVTHTTTRVAAAHLAFNLAVANYRVRREEDQEALHEGFQVELAASLLEALGKQDESADATKGMLLALGYLLYCAPVGGEVMDLCKALDARAIVLETKGHAGLAKEVASLL